MKLNTKNDVYSLMNATTPAAASGAAVETGLFWQLAEYPKPALERAAEEGLSDRIKYYPVDLASDEYPDGFDKVLVCDLGKFGLNLFQKVFKTSRASTWSM